MKKTIKFASVLCLILLAAAVALTGCGSAKDVVFETNGGSAVTGTTTDGKIGRPDDPVREGYAFSGWYTDEALSESVVFPLDAGSGATVYAAWDKLITMNFDSCGGSAVSPLVKIAGAYLKAPAAPEKYGYAFVGWYSDAACTDRYDFIAARMPSEECTLYARWTDMGVLAFYTDGGSTVADITVQPDTVVQAPSDPAKTGFAFTGWYADEACTRSFLFGKVAKGVTPVYAGWRALSQNVTVRFFNGTAELEESRTTGKEGETFSLPAVTAPDYYVFAGWCTDAACTQPFETAANKASFPAENTDLYVRWIRSAGFAKVSFVTAGGETEPVFVRKGTLLGKESVPAVSYDSATQVFDGFYDESGRSFSSDADAVYRDMVLSANVYTKGLSFEPVMIQTYNDAGLPVTLQTGWRTTGTTLNSPAHLTVPAYYRNFPVTHVGDGAFENASSVTQLALPATLENIGAGAFKGCTGLTKAHLPAGIAQVGAQAFNGCTNLAEVTYDCLIRKMGADAFTGTAYLNSFPNGYVYVGKDGCVLLAYKGKMGAFALGNVREGTLAIAGGALKDQTLYKLTALPASLDSIGESAFEGCASLIEVSIPSTVRTVEPSAFKGCVKLEKTTLGEKLESIGKSAFEGCTSLKSVTLPVTLTQLGARAFAGCTSLTSYNSFVEAVLAEFGESCFEGCTSLKSALFTDSVTTVRARAFAGCTSLESVMTGGSAASLFTTVEREAFAGCTRLKRILVNTALLNDTPVAFGENALPVYGQDGCKYNVYVVNAVPETDVGSKYYDSLTGKMQSYRTIYSSSLTGRFGIPDSAVRVMDASAPRLTLKEGVFEIKASVKFDFLQWIKENDIVAATDDQSAPEDLVYTVSWVKLNGDTIVRDEDGCYDISTEGTYSLYVRVMDEFGNYASKTVSVLVKGFGD